MRIAILHDWLDTWGGSETVVAELLRTFPGAPLFTLVDFLSPADRARLPGARIATSSLQHVPGARHWFRYAAVLRPRMIESLDLAAYDVLVSSSHSIAKGVRTRDGQTHVCYCHTPARFAWTMASTYADQIGDVGTLRRAFVDRALERFRRWDVAASAHVDRFVANSRHIARAIERCYGRTAEIVAPPVDVERFAAAADARGTAARSGYVTVSRLVAYKRVDVLVEAFRALPGRTLTVVGDGPERARLEALAAPNVEFVGAHGDAETARRVAAARAFVFAAEEDFGIAPVEAQAAGTPVIAFGRGGVRDSIRGQDDPSPTGIFFEAQAPQSIVAAIRAFEDGRVPIASAACRENALRFAPGRFRAEMARIVADARAARPRHDADRAAA